MLRNRSEKDVKVFFWLYFDIAVFPDSWLLNKGTDHPCAIDWLTWGVLYLHNSRTVTTLYLCLVCAYIINHTNSETAFPSPSHFLHFVNYHGTLDLTVKSTFQHQQWCKDTYYLMYFPFYVCAKTKVAGIVMPCTEHNFKRNTFSQVETKNLFLRTQ